MLRNTLVEQLQMPEWKIMSDWNLKANKVPRNVSGLGFVVRCPCFHSNFDPLEARSRFLCFDAAAKEFSSAYNEYWYIVLWAKSRLRETFSYFLRLDFLCSSTSLLLLHMRSHLYFYSRNFDVGLMINVTTKKNP